MRVWDGRKKEVSDNRRGWEERGQGEAKKKGATVF